MIRWVIATYLLIYNWDKKLRRIGNIHEKIYGIVDLTAQ